MWARNLLFMAVVLAGVAGLTASLYPPARPPRARHFQPQAFQESSFRSVVDDVNGALHHDWSELEVQPAPAAPELTVARRLSLALTGTIPSLQEVRQCEAQPP